jgi:hypothetical protein
MPDSVRKWRKNSNQPSGSGSSSGPGSGSGGATPAVHLARWQRPPLLVLLALMAGLPLCAHAGLDMRLRLSVPFGFNPSVRGWCEEGRSGKGDGRRACCWPERRDAIQHYFRSPALDKIPTCRFFVLFSAWVFWRHKPAAGRAGTTPFTASTPVQHRSSLYLEVATWRAREQRS